MPRPSSPTRAKASPVCASSLDQHKIVGLASRNMHKTMRVSPKAPDFLVCITALRGAQDLLSQTHVVKKQRLPALKRAAVAVLPSGFRGSRRVDSRELFGRPCGQLTRRLQKGGDPAAGSPTATLLRLRPSYRTCLRPLPPEGWVTDFGHSRLPWRDGRCVQGPGTYSPWRC